MNRSEPSPSTPLDYALLRHIGETDACNQRDLARSLGVSLGSLNYCLRAAIDRGWVKANNFRRSDNKLAYSYLLTPSGLKAKVKLARAFLERKEQEFAIAQLQLQQLRDEVARESAQHE